uniref:TF-B3 domain-containing protein n=1 Tax=Fagus sylvatica TaxID=28930 RepID=A0A2N9FJT0_FAGSY
MNYSCIFSNCVIPLQFLPPKFAATISALVNQKTFLKDSSGRQWKVEISNLDGSLAFEQGWSSFSLDHGLEIGDFVLFNYMGSHFVVNIYTKTGCEKLDFPENSNPKKRARTNCNSTAKRGQCHTIDEDWNKQGSSTSVASVSDAEISQSQCKMNDLEKILEVPENPSNHKNSIVAKPVSKAKYIEEPYYMINRDFSDKQGDDRSPMLDLFNFEMCNNNSCADVTKKAAAKDTRCSTSQRSLTEICLVDKDPVANGTVSRVGPTGASEFEMIEKSHFSEQLEKKAPLPDRSSCNDKTYGHLSITSSMTFEENKGKLSDILNSINTRCQIAEGSSDTVAKSLPRKDQVAVSSKEPTFLNDSRQSAAQKLKGMSESFDVLNTFERRGCKTGKGPKVIKREYSQSADRIVRDNNRGPGVVKAEPVDSVGVFSPNCVWVSVITSVSTDYFHPPQTLVQELPTCLPSTYKGRARKERKLVFLRDSAMRLWPVLYHERSGFKILTNGWKSFRKANNIQPGDECVFGVESDLDGVYGVHIARR